VVRGAVRELTAVQCYRAGGGKIHLRELIKQLGLSEVVLSKEEVEDVRERLRHGQAEAVAFVVGARQRRTRRAGR